MISEGPRAYPVLQLLVLPRFATSAGLPQQRDEHDISSMG